MIVKDEQKIITRCLASVVNQIDFFVIMDTGSKDNTVKTMTNFFSKHNIKGIIFKGQFKNFSQARNLSLSMAYQKSDCDFILFLDADHVLKIENKEWKKLDLNTGSYYITQKDRNLEYKNTRLIRNNKNYYYKGYTHEVLFSFIEDERKTFSTKDIWILDMSDGGSKLDKTSRDERLLLKEIKDNPSYSRPYFYLANTYFGKKDFSQAEKFYKKRIYFGGWKEELWYCYYRLGIIKIIENNIPEAIYFLQSSIETNKYRLESYFHLLVIFLKNKMDYNFQIYEKIGKEILNLNYPSSDFLFYEFDIRDKILKLLSED